MYDFITIKTIGTRNVKFTFSGYFKFVADTTNADKERHKDTDVSGVTFLILDYVHYLYKTDKVPSYEGRYIIKLFLVGWRIRIRNY